MDRPGRSASPVPSSVSMKSDNSKCVDIPAFSELSQRSTSPVPSNLSMRSDHSKEVDNPAFSKLESKADLTEDQTKCKPPPQPSDEEEDEKVAESHKKSLEMRFNMISEGINRSGDQRPLKDIYTELYITTKENEGADKEHEVCKLESAFRAQSPDAQITCNDIFNNLPGQEKHIKTVMTKGVAGIGKTVSVQKFILDWIDGAANHNVEFMFPLSFRELNIVKNMKYSLHSLLIEFYPELKKLKNCEKYKDCQILFIFDGLDESRISLNFNFSPLISDVNEITSIDVLMSSLIQGTLLPSALIWITSRPAATSQIPSHFIDKFTEVRGFSDPQKEKFFRKAISDGSQASRIIAHIKASRSLHIMCHIPVYCWIAATVLQQILEPDKTQEIPKTLTEMFIHFLLVQTTRKNQKYESGTNQEGQSQREIILKLAELAFKNLENGQIMFYEEDLRECGIDVSEASVYSGMCTEIFSLEHVIQHKKVFCFVHLSIQEFLAAIHAFVSYCCLMRNLGSLISMEELLKLAVNKVLESKNGHLDLFLRFLLGICLESNQILLQSLLDSKHKTPGCIKEISQHIKGINQENLSPERCISLLQCLVEMKDYSLLEEMKVYTFKTQEDDGQELSPAQCSTLANMLMMSEKVLDMFDLKRYNTSQEGRRRLLPALICFRTARLDQCTLNSMSCGTVNRSLQSVNSVIHLDLSRNPLKDSGVEILSDGLSSPHCKLQSLSLSDCEITGKSCEIVTQLLQTENCLKEIDLSHNDLGDSAIQYLSKRLSSPDCELERLRLSGCLITEKGCSFLVSALVSNPSRLKELDLSYNHPGESGLKLLKSRLNDPCCALEKLNVDHCAEIRFRPGVRKYACDLTFDLNTANSHLCLSERNKKVMYVTETQQYDVHVERFDSWPQVLCCEGLRGRSYWEVDWSGNGVDVAVASKSMNRKDENNASILGYNETSWNLECSNGKYTFKHNNENSDIPDPPICSKRVGVYLDWESGTLSFYSVSSDTLTRLYTIHSRFTEPIYPGFYVWPDSPVSLCQIT